MPGDELTEALRGAAAAVMPSLPVAFAYLYGSHRRPNPAGQRRGRRHRRTTRDRLVHGYAGSSTEEPPPDGVGSSDTRGADDTPVVEILRERVDDLARFRVAVARAAGG